MKIWRAYGSGHSADLTVIGTFSNIKNAGIAKELIDSFLRVAWEEEISKEEFFEEWKTKMPLVQYFGPTSSEFELWIDADPYVERDGTTVTVSGIRSVHMGAFVKLLLLNDANEVRVSGKVGP